MLTRYQVQLYPLAVDLLPNAVHKLAVCLELLSPAFCFCVIVRVAQEISLLLFCCMEGLRWVRTGSGSRKLTFLSCLSMDLLNSRSAPVSHCFSVCPNCSLLQRGPNTSQQPNNPSISPCSHFSLLSFCSCLLSEIV